MWLIPSKMWGKINPNCPLIFLIQELAFLYCPDFLFSLFFFKFLFMKNMLDFLKVFSLNNSIYDCMSNG